VIPETEFLEQFYDRQEVAALEELRPILAREKDRKKRNTMGRAALRRMWPDERTYIERTHFIKTKQPGVIAQLRFNYVQQRFYDHVIVKARNENLPIRALLLKARQMGVSTMLQSWHYEQCDREPNRQALTISYDQDSSTELFMKGDFLHRNMWFAQETVRNSDQTLELKNGSLSTVRTAGNLSAGRGDTYHHFHASEVPMWADASETLNSALQAIPERAGTSVVMESTAKGAVGEFYDAWRKAEAGGSYYVPFFAPWFWDPEYTTPFASPDHENAFGRTLDLTERRLLETHGLAIEQLHWRRRTIAGKCQGSEAKFRQEYPSTAKEAFLTTGSPVFSAEAIARLEENCTRPLWVGNIHLEIVEK